MTIVCAPPQFGDPHQHTLENPTLIVEVLSPSTAAYDRDEKFAHYQRLSSLREYVLVVSDKRRIECYLRRDGDNEWLLTICSKPGALLELPSINCSLALDEVYGKVEFPSHEPSLRSTFEDA